MKPYHKTLLFCLSLGAASVQAETLLHDNGKWVNVEPVNTPTIGTTPGISYRLPAPNTGPGGDRGWPVDWLPNINFDSAADDFTVATPVHLTRVRIYAYESAAVNTNNTITGGYLRVWNVAPSGVRLGTNDSRIVAGFIGIGPTESDKMPPMTQVVDDPLHGGAGRSIWSGVYRRDNTADVGTTRPPIALDFDVSSWPDLPAGTYWLEVSLLGSTGGQQAWVTTEERKGARAKEISGGNYIDAVGAGVGLVDDALGRTNIRPEVDLAFELYGDELHVLTCNTPFADVEGNGAIGEGMGDGDVDHEDFAVFQLCYTDGAPAHPPIPTDPAYCACFDRDNDADIDQDDFGGAGAFNTFANCQSGPMILADPGCASSPP